MKFIYVLCIIPLCLWITVSFGQQTEELTIAGTVVNETGEPINKVSIYVKDKPTGATATDDQGKFSIKAVYGDRLVFTYVGYETVEHLVVASTADLIIELSDKNVEVEEVV
ncbi:MAG: carboxypeptidase-like regulatory domain-containing protein, partial [Sphingobacterium composti]